MKKYLILLSVAALALVSCAKVKDVYTGSPASREITFSPLILNATKSGAVSNATFPTAYHFYLAASVDSDVDYTFFGGTEYANESGTTWSAVSGSKRYWPLNSETLNFLAVTKHGDDVVTFGENGLDYASKVVVAFTGNTPSSGVQHDLMYAYASSSDKTSNVSLVFNHALAWVNFTVTSNLASGVTLTGIDLNAAYFGGTATITSGGGVTWSSPQVASTGVTVPGISSPISVPTTSSTPAACGDGLLVVPHPTASSFSSFTVRYTINNENFQVVCTPESMDLEPGHKYTYNINITLTEIKVTASVGDWSVDD